MYLRKSFKNLQFIVYRQKCLNWCQIVANRRYSDEDNKDNENEDKSLENLDQIKRPDRRKSEDRVVIAKQHLNSLIDNLKTKTVFGESDPKLKELLAKPKSFIRRSARNEEPIERKDEPINEISDQIDQRLVMAAKGIASTLSGEESKKTESDLLKLLKLQALETNLAKQGKALTKNDLTSLLADMKVMREDATEDKTFDNLFKKSEVSPKFGQTFDSKERKHFGDTEIDADFQPRGKRERQPYEDRYYSQSVTHSMLTNKKRVPDWEQRSQHAQSRVDKINLFSGESIGIFDPDMTQSTESPKLLLWDRLLDDELQYIIAQPPKNAFEEMIQWTEEGKLWKYPINNEQGLEEEERVPFYEHVLLDHLLEGFPATGPVRRFMELVITGLSSNPYITVARKEATVQYYRQYFNEREDMLQIAGALG